MSETTATFATTALSGYELLADPQFNKGTAFSETEREAFDLHGLLPPNVATLDEQVSRRLQARVYPRPTAYYSVRQRPFEHIRMSTAANNFFLRAVAE